MKGASGRNSNKKDNAHVNSSDDGSYDKDYGDKTSHDNDDKSRK